MQCQICGAPATQKSGVSKQTGKPWRGMFCSADKNHVQWEKIGGGQPKFTVETKHQGITEERWDELHARKREEIREGMAFNKAMDFVIAQYSKGEIRKEDFMPTLTDTFIRLKAVLTPEEENKVIPF